MARSGLNTTILNTQYYSNARPVFHFPAG
jgi:hypothetical protein